MRIALYVFLVFAVATVGIICGQSAPEKRIAKQDGGAETKKPDSAGTEHASPNVTVIVKQESAPSDKPTNPQSQENIEIERKLARFTKWLVIVGFIQAGILGLTVWVIYQQVVLARTSERAFVFFRGIDSSVHVVDAVTNQTTHWHLGVQWVNIGTIGTKGLKMHVTCRALNVDLSR